MLSNRVYPPFKGHVNQIMKSNQFLVMEEGDGSVLDVPCIFENIVRGIFFLNYQPTRIPNSSSPPAPSQKPSHGNISVTKRGIIDPLMSKQPEKF